MKTKVLKHQKVLSIFIILFLNCCCVISAGAQIIEVTGNKITMTNDVGSKLDFFYENGKYGLGTFYFENKALGEPIPYFLTEDNMFANSNNTFQQIWKGEWHPYFQAEKYEILKNTSDTGSIKFSGSVGKFQATVLISLTSSINAYQLEYSVKMLETAKHPLYVSVPFSNDNMEFVQYPFETPLMAPFKSNWYITPTRSMVPFMFGCEKFDHEDYFVGIGYQFGKDPYEKGKLEYDATQPSPFQLYFISPFISETFAPKWRGANNYELHMVISTAGNQYDCINSYRKASGYDISTTIYRTIDRAVQGVMNLYEKTTSYGDLPPLKHKAYRHQIVPSSGAPPLYSRWGTTVNIGINVQLGYQLYKYWLQNRSADWALERVINLAGLYTESQNEDGSVPSLWIPEEKKFGTYFHILDQRGYIFTTDRMAFGAMNLYKLYLARKETENIVMDDWKKSALKAMDYIVSKIEPNGFLGRSYTKDGRYDTGAAPNETLVALDYFYATTGDEKYNIAMKKIENFTYENFGKINHWHDWSSDFGAWGGAGAPPWNNDALNIQTFVTYCVYRHMHTSDDKYIKWAKDVLAYNWLVTVPVQFEGYQHVTKGLTREQDFYPTYDNPFRTTILIDCYPYLSMVTGDRFFMDFYRLLIQTQHSFQYPSKTVDNLYGDNIFRKGLESFDLGLQWGPSYAEPLDEIGEPGINYVVEFTSMYLESVTSPNAYRYVGGPDWGVGLDYDLTYKPASKSGEPFIRAASSQLVKTAWNPQSKVFSATLKGKVGDKGMLLINTGPVSPRMNQVRATVNGTESRDVVFSYDEKLKSMKLEYTLNKELSVFEIVLPVK